jgi:GxxExxY protein
MGEFVPELIAFGRVIIDAKVVEMICDVERGQMINFLRATYLRMGLFLFIRA